ncbi:transposon Tf2-12 poly protein, partial [Favolaschia claudopus]
FEDVSSISQAPPMNRDTRDFSVGPENTLASISPQAGDQAEEFQASMDRKIIALVDKQLGEALDLPSRIKAPKLTTPAPFTGDKNDSDDFMLFVENVTTWMRAQFLGGPDVDGYRVTLLKTLLLKNAHDWFLDYVEGRNGPATVPNNFTSILCALHRRFITFSTAQRASKAFEAIRYRPEDGPTKLMDDLVSASRKM